MCECNCATKAADIFRRLELLTAQLQNLPAVISPIFTVDEAAAYMKVQRTAIFNWEREGKIQMRRVSGRKTVILRADLDRLIAEADTKPNDKTKLVEARRAKHAADAAARAAAPAAQTDTAA